MLFGAQRPSKLINHYYKLGQCENCIMQSYAHFLGINNQQLRLKNKIEPEI